MVMVRNQLFERAAQQLAGRLDLVEKAFFEHDVEHRLSRGARERVADIGRSMRADDHPARRLSGRETRAERKRVGWGTSESVRVDIGGRPILKKKKRQPG